MTKSIDLFCVQVSILFGVVFGSIFAIPCGAQTGKISDISATVDIVQTEQNIIATVHAAARQGNDSAADAGLLRSDGLAQGKLSNAVLAQRAVGVCAWLRSEGEYGRAIKVATRIVARLTNTKDANEGEHVERLYWEAMLEADYLNHKKEAFALLREAEKLAPNDERISASELQLAQAMSELGN